MYKWKVILKNNKTYIVESPIDNIKQFVNQILGDGKSGIIANAYKLAAPIEYKYGEDFSYKITTNVVAIIGSEVSSVEFYN